VGRCRLDGGVVGHGHALAPGHPPDQLVPRELRRPVPMSLREQRVQEDGSAPVVRQPQPVRDVRPDEPGAAGDQDPRTRRTLSRADDQFLMTVS
jgi:hypothetical protein